MIKNHVDVLVLTETKLDSTFPQQQFILDGFKQPYHLDVKANSGDILVYVNNQTSPMEINSLPIPNDIQAIPLINLIKCKWLLFPIYKPPSQNEGYFIDQKEGISDSLSNSIRNCLTFGYLNMEVANNMLSSFIENYRLYSLIKSPTCFKSSTNPICIDQMLTNMKSSFFASQSFEMGFGDYHPLIYTVLNTQFTKPGPKSITFHDYK